MKPAGEASNPRALVEAPVRHALRWLVVRGVGLFAVVAALAICPVVCALEAGTRDALAMAAPLLLFGYSLTVHARRLLLGPVAEDRRTGAWERAQEIDVDDAMLGRLVCGWVPIGLLAALAVLVWPHITDANPALACAWVVIGLPPIAVAWLVASSTWLDAARDDLARAELRSDALLRSYWANLGG